MYLELIYRPRSLADQYLHPDQARRLVAAACDGLHLPALFNRDDDGKTLQGRYGDDRDGEGAGVPPLVSFDGGKGYVRLYGLGAAGRDILMAAATPVLSALSRAHGPTTVALLEGECQIKATGHQILHRISRLVLFKRPGPARKALVTDPATRDALRRAIGHGLLAQARLLGGALEGSVPRDEEIEILEGLPCPVPIQPDILAVGYKNLVVALPVRLIGPWQTGRLRSRGYGRIRPLNPTRGDNA